MCDVPRLDRRQRHIRQESEHWCAGIAGAAGINLLHDFYSGFSSSQIQLKKQTKYEVDDQSQLLNIDVEKRTTRGRSCPVCGGKIIPSERAVYQNTADPAAVYPSWMCERCGYEELVERPQPAARKH